MNKALTVLSLSLFLFSTRGFAKNLTVTTHDGYKVKLNIRPQGDALFFNLSHVAEILKNEPLTLKLISAPSPYECIIETSSYVIGLDYCNYGGHDSEGGSGWQSVMGGTIIERSTGKKIEFYLQANTYGTNIFKNIGWQDFKDSDGHVFNLNSVMFEKPVGLDEFGNICEISIDSVGRAHAWPKPETTTDEWQNRQANCVRISGNNYSSIQNLNSDFWVTLRSLTLKVRAIVARSRPGRTSFAIQL